MRKENSYWKFHREHCCSEHGCNFGDNDCPVVSGLTTHFFCEECENENYYFRAKSVNEVRSVIKEAIEKYNIKIDMNDSNIETLISYVLLVGYKDGCKGRNEK